MVRKAVLCKIHIESKRLYIFVVIFTFSYSQMFKDKPNKGFKRSDLMSQFDTRFEFNKMLSNPIPIEIVSAAHTGSMLTDK